ncbi:preprotein translocase subunit SecA [Acholeplasma laidlawii]|jgi:preprotein translocase subunit SecA|uniref:Protein translocase subunit SecA n=2 Tax=Acholeplasma laidlawii TaxID=2148 RepID=A9NF22_ACHLI|nr:preprotein translocase subunit SecA [Acholeplasma laidlawii]ABX80952.1 preprotein translocase, SecA subunit [Acholeplasma laidlawii PG-8A]NWH10483.1 preprotein translocase subunit SecA [Acholeplasma laidlawii]NWH11871.1 preprotein translocase subunit SecA [Acholeplasma laidlawii]NWH12721.1 preprotein translocase subunit SecA [Acholeplasma laidlawii]NWH13900.1 preprotein translocase subunit SecA [Acholeplasma laidlawii]
MFGLFDSTKKAVKKYNKVAHKIMALEDTMKAMSDEALKNQTKIFKDRIKNGETLDDILVEAFATVREASKRVTGLTPYFVQLVGGMSIHDGNIAEMRTGEGKTLTAVLPAYLNALNGDGVHIVTVNEYLAKREAEGEIGDLFRFLGLTVGLNIRDLDREGKKAAYACDIMYSTNSELGFDYLRDHMVLYHKDMVAQRGYPYAIIDEVDSILIDEARTPLIISGPAKQTQNLYQQSDRFVKSLSDHEYELDVESNTVELTPEGIAKAESVFNIENLYDLSHVSLLHHINNALKANFTMFRDKEYMVVEGEVLIIDQFTGRVLKGRQFSEGLHQALEAKENVEIKKETVTVATITYQNFFRMYKKLSGMTGTAKTEEDEFIEIYNMSVIEIPTNKPVIREDAKDYFFVTAEEKYQALIEEIKRRHEIGQPILIGTIAVETSEFLSMELRKHRINHEVLNAKNHEREAEIVAKAGQKGAVTIATNMAGRGTDIKLGEGVVELGGLAVLGSEKHDARRIDNQLRGRSGRQGDPGFSRFYLSAEDELMVRRGGDRFRTIIETLQRAQATGEPVTSKMITSLITGAQKRSEGVNSEIRKNVLRYDDVLRVQREIIYAERTSILTKETVEEEVIKFIETIVEAEIDEFIIPHGRNKFEIKDEAIVHHFESFLIPKGMVKIEDVNEMDEVEIVNHYKDLAIKLLVSKKEVVPQEVYNEFLKVIMLRVIDTYWMRHIDAMSELRQGVRLQSYGQQNPLIIYQKEGKRMFDEMRYNISKDIARYAALGRIELNVSREAVVKNTSTNQGEDASKQKRKQPKRAHRSQLPWNRR